MNQWFSICIIVLFDIRSGVSTDVALEPLHISRFHVTCFCVIISAGAVLAGHFVLV